VAQVSARTRVFATVAVAAVAVAGATVSVTWLQSRGGSTQAAVHPRQGVPPLFFDFGLRNDAEVRDLSRGATLLGRGKRAQALALFERHHSVQAQLGEAFAKWPDLDAVTSIAARNQRNAVAQLHLGLALSWAGRNADAVKTLQRVATQFPDTPSAVDAGTLLYSRRFVPGLPLLIVPVDLPEASTLAEQVAIARRAAADGGEKAKLAYGAILWRLNRVVSARRELAAAAKLAPNDPVALTAAGVSRFAKPDPTPAFAALGPLTGRFPHAAVVRFHLGLLLIWTRRLAKARAQLRLAIREAPDSVYARQAGRLLSALPRGGTK
jgi:tetratricopeptide (TPR) repeat protein